MKIKSDVQKQHTLITSILSIADSKWNIFQISVITFFLNRICSFYIIQCIKQNGNGKIDTCINHKQYLWYICRYIVLFLMVSKYLLLVNLLENKPLVNKIYLDIWPNLSFLINTVYPYLLSQWDRNPRYLIKRKSETKV